MTTFNSIVDRLPYQSVSNPNFTYNFQFYSRSTTKLDTLLRYVQQRTFNSIVDRRCNYLESFVFTVSPTFNSIVDRHGADPGLGAVLDCSIFQFYSRSTRTSSNSVISAVPQASFNSIVDRPKAKGPERTRWTTPLAAFNSIVDRRIATKWSWWVVTLHSRQTFNSIVDRPQKKRRNTQNREDYRTTHLPFNSIVDRLCISVYIWTCVSFKPFNSIVDRHSTFSGLLYSACVTLSIL